MKVDVCIPSKRGVSQKFLDDLNGEKDVNRILISNSKPITDARTELIKKVTTDFFIFFDDDIEYPKGLIPFFLDSIIIKEDCGGIQAFTRPFGLGEKWDSNLLPLTEYKILKKGERMMTSNCIIRTETVKDWSPNANVSGCEDFDLTLHIQSRGYYCYVVKYGDGIKHKTNWKKIKNNAFWYARGYYNITGRDKTIQKIFNLTRRIVHCLITLPFNFRRNIFTIYQNCIIIIGFLRVTLLKI